MNIAIIGAGALGCGLFYPMCVEAGHDVYLYDTEQTPVEWEACWVGSDTTFSQRYMTVINTHVNNTPAPDLVFTAVPPGEIPRAALKLRNVVPETPIVCFENIRDPASLWRKHLPANTLLNGIAWVSAFREGMTARRYELQRPLGNMLRFMADTGIVEVEEQIALAHPRLVVMEDYERSYDQKMLIHNAVHAVIAYRGWALGLKTIPETFSLLRPMFDEFFYAMTQLFPQSSARIALEYARFSNPGFPDLVERVARTPSRKLMRGERLPALYQALDHHPRHQRLVRLAIDDAIDFGELYDPMVTLWVQQNGRESFVRDFCGIVD